MPYSASLTDPPLASPLADAMVWVQTIALGTVATAIAVMAVAAVGMLMLAGRFQLKRGILVILGCFILFGARGIGEALGGLVGSEPQSFSSSNTAAPPMAPYPRPLPIQAYDPYAGAALPAQGG